jgi:hypothetical protein
VQVVALGYSSKLDKSTLMHFISETLGKKKKMSLAPASTSSFQKPRNDCVHRITVLLVSLLASGPVRQHDHHLDNTLFNIALDNVHTDLVLISPVGFTFPPGMVTTLAHTLTETKDTNSTASLPKALLLPSYIPHHLDRSNLLYPSKVATVNNVTSSYDMSHAVRCGMMSENSVGGVNIQRREAEMMITASKKRETLQLKDANIVRSRCLQRHNNNE